MNNQAETAIKTHALYAAGGGLIPIPIVDFLAVSGIQIDLVQNLCQIYNLNFYKHQGKSLISALAGTSLATLGSSFIKAIPGVGSFLGGVSMSLLSGASTYAIGQVFAQHFENGGTMEDLNAEEFQAFYKQKVEEGKKVVEDLKNREETKTTAQQKKKQQPKTNSNLRQTKLEDKLADVKRLYESGIITKSEFDAMRKKLFEDYIG